MSRNDVDLQIKETEYWESIRDEASKIAKENETDFYDELQIILEYTFVEDF